MQGKITLSGMEFYAYHGCFAEEKVIGTRFIVDLVLSYNMKKAALQDDVTKTVNYQSVYKDIKNIMEQPVNLLETICLKILTTIKSNYSLIESLHVTVSKLNPFLGGKVDRVSVSGEL